MSKRSTPDVFLFFRVLLFAAAGPFLLRLKLSRVETLLEPRTPSSADGDRVEQITEYVEKAIRAGRPPWCARDVSLEGSRDIIFFAGTVWTCPCSQVFNLRHKLF
jgi:hypothetical protein